MEEYTCRRMLIFNCGADLLPDDVAALGTVKELDGTCACVSEHEISEREASAIADKLGERLTATYRIL